MNPIPRRARTGRALVLLAALAGASPAGAQTGRGAGEQGPLAARLQAQLDSLHAAGRFPGATLGVALADGRVLAFATGMADTAARIPMTGRARMLAGSVGKTYVAAVAMQLVAEGRLQLDAPLSRWLGREPWFPRLPNADAMTIRMLMNHTSGLVRYEFDPAVTRLLTDEPDHVWSPEERISYILDSTPPFAAGAGWQYSDTNYIVLGLVIERITGAPLYREIERRILRPLGLDDTLPSDRRDLPGVVQGYAGPDNPFGRSDAMIRDGRFIVNPQMEWAGGGYAATAPDLARWARLLWSGRAFDPALLPLVLDGVPATPLGTGARYGLGVILTPTDLGEARGHSGFFPGYLTEVRYYPDLDVGIAIQFNTSVGRALGWGTGPLLHAFARTVASRSPGGPPAGGRPAL